MAARRHVRVLARLGLLVLSLVLAVAASGCASDDPEAGPDVETEAVAPAPTVELQDRSTQVTGGRALHFTASTGAKLSGAGGRLAIELGGVYVDRGHHPMPGASDFPLLACVALPCEWTVVPDDATTYEFQAFLINLDTRKSTAESARVRAVWTAPPRPHALKFLINGKSMPLVPLSGGEDDYLDIPAGKMQLEARWTTDARDTGYYVVISTSEPKKRDYATCSTGTSCLVPVKVPILVDQEMTWEVKVLTTRGDKVAVAFRVCLIGRP